MGGVDGEVADVADSRVTFGHCELIHRNCELDPWNCDFERRSCDFHSVFDLRHLRFDLRHSCIESAHFQVPFRDGAFTPVTRSSRSSL